MRGDPGADEQFSALYDELRGIAARVLSKDRGNAIAPTSIVHEAYLRLSKSDGTPWSDRTHFLALAARCMRNVLVDHHRRAGAAKRGGDWQRVTLSGQAELGDAPVDAIALEEALAELEGHDPRQARVVELRFFGGMTNDEVAAELDISRPTVEREWRHARAWLGRRLEA